MAVFCAGTPVSISTSPFQCSKFSQNGIENAKKLSSNYAFCGSFANRSNDHLSSPVKLYKVGKIRAGENIFENIGEALKNALSTNGGFARKGSSGKPLYTTGAGTPVPDDNNTLTIGDTGTMIFEDFHFFDKQAHFNRERVPERVVHAKGTGAHGYFEVTQDVSDLCKASFLSNVGKKTAVFARFSGVTGESGFIDTNRDIKGFAWKFYTEEGIWDMVGNNTPVFFVRDPLKFPDLIHAMKRNPQTNLRDPNSFWDFLSLVPESLHQVLITFSPRGIPDSYRHMHGFGSHTFKMVNKDGLAHWVKFHFISEQGIHNLNRGKALEIGGIDPDYLTRDLFEAIARGDNPSWKFYIQAMPLDDAPKYKWDPFDLTKVWLHGDYPLREVGRLVLNRNPGNFFAEVEQVAFSPAHMPPGIEPSPDRMLQSRLFAYDDTQRHRIGGNFLQVPINRCPFAKVQNYQRDGPMNVTENGGSRPNYYPNSFDNLPRPDPQQPDILPYHHPGGTVGRYTPALWKDQDDFIQPRMLWQRFSQKDKQETVANIAGHIRNAMPMIQKRQLQIFRKCDNELADMLEQALEMKKKSPEPYSMVA